VAGGFFEARSNLKKHKRYALVCFRFLMCCTLFAKRYGGEKTLNVKHSLN
jgi:hypothetical protein